MYMNVFFKVTRISQFIAISLMFMNFSHASEPDYIELTQGGLTITAGFDVPHGTNQEVTLIYSIKNHGLSIVKLGYIRQTPPFEGFNPQHVDILELRIWTPMGEPVLSFYDLPRNSSLGAKVTLQGRLSISEMQIKPNEEVTRRIDLSKYFPLTQVGQYRCHFVRRVYVQDSMVVGKQLPARGFRSGVPIRLDLPNLTFNIPKVDPSFNSSLSSIAATDSVAPTKNTSRLINVTNSTSGFDRRLGHVRGADGQLINPPPTPKAPEAKPPTAAPSELASSTLWSVIVILIVTALGLLWLLLKRRS